MKTKMVITYPPDFDGELHIDVEEKDNYYFEYSFRHAKQGTAWETLVKTARAIVAQNDRRRK